MSKPKFSDEERRLVEWIDEQRNIHTLLVRIHALNSGREINIHVHHTLFFYSFSNTRQFAFSSDQRWELQKRQRTALIINHSQKKKKPINCCCFTLVSASSLLDLQPVFFWLAGNISKQCHFFSFFLFGLDSLSKCRLYMYKSMGVDLCYSTQRTSRYFFFLLFLCWGKPINQNVQGLLHPPMLTSFSSFCSSHLYIYIKKNRVHIKIHNTVL